MLSPEEAASLRDMPALVLKWDAPDAPPVGTALTPGPLVRHDDRLYFWTCLIALLFLLLLCYIKCFSFYKRKPPSCFALFLRSIILTSDVFLHLFLNPFHLRCISPPQDSCYVLPPVWYPNGEGWAVKMGHGKAFEQVGRITNWVVLSVLASR